MAPLPRHSVTTCVPYLPTHPPTHPPTHRAPAQVEAEKAAWHLAEELGLDVVTILPNFVLVRDNALPGACNGLHACIACKCGASAS
jgi:hypothetical protein